MHGIRPNIIVAPIPAAILIETRKIFFTMRVITIGNTNVAANVTDDELYLD